MKKIFLLLIYVPLIGFNQDIKETSSMSKKELNLEIKSLNKTLDSLRLNYYNETETIFDTKHNTEKLRSKKSLILEINKLNVIIDNYYQYIQLKEHQKRESELVIGRLNYQLDSLRLIHDFSSSFRKCNSNKQEDIKDQIRYILDSLSKSIAEFESSIKNIPFVSVNYDTLIKNGGKYDYQNHKLKNGPPQKIRDYTLHSETEKQDLFVVNAHVFQKLNHINNQNSDTIVYNGYIINGLFQGPWKEYYENGNVHRIRYYINGVQTILFRYHENGNLERVKNYVNDLLGGIYKREWNSDGYFIVETETDPEFPSTFRFYDSERYFLIEFSEGWLKNEASAEVRNKIDIFMRDLWNNSLSEDQRKMVEGWNLKEPY